MQESLTRHGIYVSTLPSAGVLLNQYLTGHFTGKKAGTIWVRPIEADLEWMVKQIEPAGSRSLSIGLSARPGKRGPCVQRKRKGEGEDRVDAHLMTVFIRQRGGATGGAEMYIYALSFPGAAAVLRMPLLLYFYQWKKPRSAANRDQRRLFEQPAADHLRSPRRLWNRMRRPFRRLYGL